MMKNRKSSLHVKSYLYRWFGFCLVIVMYLLLFFSCNFFKIRTLTASTISLFKANVEYRKAQWGDAEIQYKKALEDIPNSNVALCNLGNSYYQQGRYSEALAVFVRLSQDKNNKCKLATWSNLGNTYYQLGDYEKSYKAFKIALLQDDANIVVRQNFLFLSRLLEKDSLKQIHSEKRKETKNRDAQKKAEESEQTNGEQDKNKTPPSTYHFSDKEMNDMLQQAKDKVRVPNGTKSKSNTTKNNQLDY